MRAGERLIEAFELTEPNRRSARPPCDSPAEQPQRHFGRQRRQNCSASRTIMIAAKILGQSSASPSSTAASIAASARRSRRRESARGWARSRPFACERGHQRAQARSGKAGSRFDASSANPISARCKRRDEPRLRNPQERPHQHDRPVRSRAERDSRAMAPSPAMPAAAAHAHEHGLGLIVERVRSDNVRRPALSCAACASSR